jgi:hypothetical protein
MKVLSAEFVTSSDNLKNCPEFNLVISNKLVTSRNCLKVFCSIFFIKLFTLSGMSCMYAHSIH